MQEKDEVPSFVRRSLDAPQKDPKSGADDLRLFQSGKIGQSPQHLAVSSGESNRSLVEPQHIQMQPESTGCNPAAELYGEGMAVQLSPAELPTKSEYAGVPAVAVSDADRLALDWLLSTDKGKSPVERVLARLIQAEAHEPNVWLRDDYRQSFITLTLASRGNTMPFVAASYQMYGCHPDKLHDKIIDRRHALLGPLYDVVENSETPETSHPTVTTERGIATRIGNCVADSGAVSGELPAFKEPVLPGETSHPILTGATGEVSPVPQADDLSGSFSPKKPSQSVKPKGEGVA